MLVTMILLTIILLGLGTFFTKMGVEMLKDIAKEVKDLFKKK